MGSIMQHVVEKVVPWVRAGAAGVEKGKIGRLR